MQTVDTTTAACTHADFGIGVGVVLPAACGQAHTNEGQTGPGGTRN